jgi:hypothetical protein
LLAFLFFVFVSATAASTIPGEPFLLYSTVIVVAQYCTYCDVLCVFRARARARGPHLLAACILLLHVCFCICRRRESID